MDIATALVATNLVVACILGESSNKTKDVPNSYLMTAWVIRNRAEHPLQWPDTAEQVVTQRLQFSAMNDPIRVKRLLRYKAEYPTEWKMARKQIERALRERPYQDPTFGACHYVTEDLYNSDRKGFWIGLRVRTVRHGHVFLE